MLFVTARKIHDVMVKDKVPARMGTQKPDWWGCSMPTQMDTIETNAIQAAIRPHAVMSPHNHIFLNNMN